VATLNDFAKRIGTIAVKVEDGTGRLTRAVALAADQAVVVATPVDTGRARSNWLVEVDAPAAGTREPYVPGSKLGTGERDNLQGALDQGAGVVGRFDVKRNQSIHITNNLPYIQRLNDGWSAQAPAGFVEAAVQAAVRAVRGSKILGG
jgi:hypothetical protein